MDDLTELLGLIDAGEPLPDNLAERLWPEVRSTFRLTRAGASDSSSGEGGDRADVDELYPVVISLDDARGPGRLGRRVAVLAVAAVVVAAGVVGYAISSGDETDEAPPVASSDRGDGSPRPVDELCASIDAGVRAAVSSGDLTGLTVLVADLRELADQVESGTVDAAEPELADDIRRAANTFDQARRSFEAGDPAVANQAAQLATVLRSPTVTSELGALTACLP